MYSFDVYFTVVLIEESCETKLNWYGYKKWIIFIQDVCIFFLSFYFGRSLNGVGCKTRIVILAFLKLAKQQVCSADKNLTPPSRC